MVTDFSPLKAILTGSIILQTENAEKYQEKINGSWNATIRTCKPRAFVKVASVSDVVSTVKFCVKNEVKIFSYHLEICLDCRIRVHLLAYEWGVLLSKSRS